MKRILSALRSLAVFAAVAPAAFGAFAQAPQPPEIAARTYMLVDVTANQVLAAKDIDAPVEQASLTKLMTGYLVFDALRAKKVTLDQKLPVSVRAWKMPGSRMFIDPKMQVPVEDLIKGMIVQSGNDACVALAETIAGSEDNFAQMMNREAQRLGMKASSFRNSTGLPDPQHYTTARDLATLAGALIRDFPEDYAKYYSMKEFRYNNITQHNRNRLLWLDPTVDGVKTGHTDAAGYCLISSAKRDTRRLISVVLGTKSDAVRAQESLKLLNFGFQAYDAVKLYAKNEAVSNLKVWKGTEKTVKAGFTEDFIMVVPKGYGPRIKSELQSQQPLIAPVAQGQIVGTMKVSLDDKPYGEFPVVAIDGVPVAGIFGRAIDTIRLWFN